MAGLRYWVRLFCNIVRLFDNRNIDILLHLGESNRNDITEVPKAAMTDHVDVTNEEVQKTQADPETAERFIAEKHIGHRIRRLRLKKSMGLVELGRHTGLSASFLSQLETGRVVPTLRNLARIAMVFSKDLSYFFECEPIAIFRVHRQKDRVRLPQTGVEPPTYTFESLGFMVPDRYMDPYFAEFIPQAGGAEPKAHMHPGYEFLYLLSGELEIAHGDHHTTIVAGDAVYFDSSTPHSYRCAGHSPAGAIIVTMHQPLQAQPQPTRSQVTGTNGPRLVSASPPRTNGSEEAAEGRF
jgi:transcriptional regulator with XRE-family HTH domain